MNDYDKKTAMNRSLTACALVTVSCSAFFSSRLEAAVTLEWSTDGSNLLGGNTLDPGEINQAGATSKPGTLNEYFFPAPAGNYMVQVMTRNMNRFQATTANAVYMEGQIGTIQSTMRMRFFDLVPAGGGGFTIGAPVALTGIHFTFDDAESSEWIYNFAVDTVGATIYSNDINAQTAPGTILDFTNALNPGVFNFSGGALLKDANVNYASNNEPLESGTQPGKIVDVDLSSLGGVYGYEFSLRRNSSSPGGMVMQFQAPEPSSSLLVAVSCAGMLLRRRRTV